MFNPDRLTLARLRAGLSKTELATQAGVSVRTITNYETGQQQPEGATLLALARILRFPPEYFDKENAPVIDKADRDKISFRARSKMTRGQTDTAVASMHMGAEIRDWLNDRLTLPAVDIPDYADCDPETAAACLRQAWGLGQMPIAHLLDVVESHGVMVFSLAMDTAVVDAFSVWHDGLPMIFLNRQKTAERCRFDLAHELGHLLLHTRGKPQGREAEQEADQFASALLMPRDAMLAEPVGAGTLDRLVIIKQRWRVSAAALNYRLHKLGRISEWMYRSNCITLAQMGRNTEPQPGLPFEASQLWHKIFAALQQLGPGRSGMARDLQYGLPRLLELTFGPEVLDGGGAGGTPPQTATPSLRILK